MNIKSYNSINIRVKISYNSINSNTKFIPPTTNNTFNKHTKELDLSQCVHFCLCQKVSGSSVGWELKP